MTSTTPGQPNHCWVSQYALSINGKMTDITKEELLAICKSVSVKNAAEIIDDVNAVISQWKQYADEVALSPALRDQIAETLIRWSDFGLFA